MTANDEPPRERRRYVTVDELSALLTSMRWEFRFYALMVGIWATGARWPQLPQSALSFTAHLLRH